MPAPVASSSLHPRAGVLPPALPLPPRLPFTASPSPPGCPFPASPTFQKWLSAPAASSVFFPEATVFICSYVISHRTSHRSLADALTLGFLYPQPPPTLLSEFGKNEHDSFIPVPRTPGDSLPCRLPRGQTPDRGAPGPSRDSPSVRSPHSLHGAHGEALASSRGPDVCHPWNFSPGWLMVLC